MYKFRLHELLLRLSVIEYREALEVLPKLLKISKRTFYKWIYLKEDEHYDITHTNICLLANYFNVTPAELYTNPNPVIHEADTNYTRTEATA